MITDIFTMMWKEWKEVFLMRGSIRSGLFNLGIIIFLTGVFMPLQAGAAWLTTPILPIAWSWLPIFMALSMVTDAFAGERERHTLETLLASRLSDRAILFGKIAAAVSYSWLISLVGMLIGAVTINIAHPTGTIQFYALSGFAGGLVAVFLGALLISSLGVLVSLKAPTARQAYQRLSVVMLGLWLVPSIGFSVIPESVKMELSARLQSINFTAVGLAILAGLVVVDAVLLWVNLNRFRRARLILD